MFQIVKTKSGDTLLVKSSSESFGRHDIALLMFATWERQQQRNINKLAKGILECSG